MFFRKSFGPQQEIAFTTLTCAHGVLRMMKNSIPYHPLSKDLLSAVFKLDPKSAKECIEARFAPQMTAMLLHELDEQIRRRVVTASMEIKSGTEISDALARLSKELKRYFDIRKRICSHTVGKKAAH